MNASHLITKGKTNRQIANMALRAMSELTGDSNGTINRPFELASTMRDDGRTLIETIYKDGYVRHNDGWYIVEVDDYCLYVDLTGYAMKEMGITEREIKDNTN